MGAKQYKLNIDVCDENLQQVLDVLSKNRCMKSFVLASIQTFADSYKGQHLFELITATAFPFEKKKRAGRASAGKQQAVKQKNQATAVPERTITPRPPKSSESTVSMDGKQAGGPDSDSILSGLLKRKPAGA